MQGIDEFIPTENKIRYINQLLKVGFDTIDFGSFVSPKVIPQMKDTSTVYRGLDFGHTKTQLLAIVANARGATDASTFEKISFVGFPLSISETFQQRNTNKTIAEALNELQEIKNICVRSGKQLVVYISMGYGNPYGDRYEESMVSQFAGILATLGADIISVADTVGLADASQIESLMRTVIADHPALEIGVHLHARPEDSAAKVLAAWNAGCRRIDGALMGYGGCPMAGDVLVGNIDTRVLIKTLRAQGVAISVDEAALRVAQDVALRTFPAVNSSHR